MIDPGAYANIQQRSWVFRTVGDGHDAALWRALVHELQVAGYGGALRIEDEDPHLSADEAVAKAAAFLQEFVGDDRAPGASPE